MSSRYISIEEINSIVAAVGDKDGIEILKKVRDSQKKESDEDRKEEQKYNTERSDLSQEDRQKRSDAIAEKKAFVGFAKEDDVIGGNEGKDNEGKKGILERLVTTGLLLKGGFVPREKERINSYKLSDEGFALLYLVDKLTGKSNSNNKQQEQQPQQQKQQEQDTKRLSSTSSSSSRGRHG